MNTETNTLCTSETSINQENEYSTWKMSVPLYLRCNDRYVTSLYIYIQSRDIDAFRDMCLGCGIPPAVEQLLDQKIREYEKDMTKKIGAMDDAFEDLLEYSLPFGEDRKEVQGYIPDYIDPIDYKKEYEDPEEDRVPVAENSYENVE